MAAARKRTIAVMLAAWSVWALPSQGAVVTFAQSEYLVVAGQPLDLQVMIQFEPGDPAADLFSFGVRLRPETGAPMTVDDIAVPPDLDFLGVGGDPALVTIDLSVLGAKGNVFDVQNPYGHALLATYRTRFSEVGNFRAGLDFFNTLGPTEQIFVGGNGSVLDPMITFGDTTVNVIPEPAAPVLGLSAFLAFALRRTRKQAGPV